MKKTLYVLLVLSLIGSPLYAGNDFAKKSKSTDAAPQAAAVSAPAAQKPIKMSEAKKKLEELKKGLNGSEWQVEMSSGGKVMDKDTFTFQNNMVTCKTLKDRGYPPTNYTVSMPEGADMATWETMQTSAKGQVVFIRGEWKDDVMRGVMSEQLEDGKTKDYNFHSASKAVVPPTTEEKKEPKAEETKPAETAMVSEPVVEDKVAAFEPGTTDEIKKEKVKNA